MTRIAVHQQDGQIRISRGGHARTYKVKRGIVNVPDDEAAGFLRRVRKSRLVETATPSPVEPTLSASVEAEPVSEQEDT